MLSEAFRACVGSSICLTFVAEPFRVQLPHFVAPLLTAKLGTVRGVSPVQQVRYYPLNEHELLLANLYMTTSAVQDYTVVVAHSCCGVVAITRSATYVAITHRSFRGSAVNHPPAALARQTDIRYSYMLRFVVLRLPRHRLADPRKPRTHAGPRLAVRTAVPSSPGPLEHPLMPSTRGCTGTTGAPSWS